MKRRSVIFTMAIAILLSACKEEIPKTKDQFALAKATKVEAIAANVSANELSYSYSGIVTPSVNIPISFQMPGRVTDIFVEEGDFVKKGELLAVLNKESAENSYNAAMASKRQAEDAYQRLKKVYDKGSLPDIQWEEVKAQVDQAKSAAAISKHNLENCEIRAPRDGVIGSRSMEIGQSITPNISVVELVVIDEVYVRISVPENEINKMLKGAEATVLIEAIGTQPFTAQVERIGVVANPISKTYEVKLRMDNSNYMAKPGMVCDVEMNLPTQSTSITVPFQAVMKDHQEKDFVYVVDTESKKAIKKEVQVGKMLKNEIQLLSGVSKGDLIVIEGQHKIEDQSLLIL